MPWLEEHKNRRMAEDAAMISDITRWPGPVLRLKTQPWVTEAEGRMKFAKMIANEPLTVYPEAQDPVRFSSVESMVERWSVD